MARKPVRTLRWDAADHLRDDKDIAAYLDAAFEDGDPQLIAAALGDVARSRGMTRVATRAGLGRESLYKALSPQGNPEFATVVKVMQALGFRLIRSPVSPSGGKASVSTDRVLQHEDLESPQVAEKRTP